MGVHESAQRGFGAGAGDYDRARPGYPAEAVEWICERLGVGPGRTVVDLGAGTGKLTRMLLGRGATVVAVEPVESMRDRLAAAMPDVPAVSGTAKDMPLGDGSADVVTVAQAFHWFDSEPALVEISRVLRPGGGVALIWNTWDADQPLQRSLHRIVERYRKGAPGHCYRERSDDEAWRSRWTSLLEGSPHFDGVEQRSFAMRQSFERERLRERIASISYIAALPREERQAALAEVAGLAAGLPTRIDLDYVTDAFVARLRA
jgi:ubiquinone/menaquinone biosynthesis C-methylase UbiE